MNPERFDIICEQIERKFNLIDDGVECILDRRLEEFTANGMKLYVCAYGAQKKGIEPSEAATFGGLAILSELISVCDRFISFN